MKKKDVLTLRDAVVFIQSLEPAELAQLRNDVEIWIYHAEERVSLLAKYSWFVCALAAIMGILDSDVVVLIVALVTAGIAYTMRSLENRFAAILLAAAGVLVAIDVPYRLLAPNRPHELLFAFAVSVVLAGAGAAQTIRTLKNLRAFRSLIPLPPADHLL